MRGVEAKKAILTVPFDLKSGRQSLIDKENVVGNLEAALTETQIRLEKALKRDLIS